MPEHLFRLLKGVIMSNIVHTASSDIFKKLEILTDAAKYDVACTSSGVTRNGQSGSMGNAAAGGICHCFSADGRCISLLKILYTNECVYDCKYCVNRLSNDVPRATFTPEEIAELTISFYRRNYIEGLFLSSGIRNNPNDTMEQIFYALYLLRQKYHFNGYIHVKAIPGADPALVEMTGWLADRMSTNLELPTTAGLKKLAPQKSRKNILTPMKQIQIMQKKNREFHGLSTDLRHANLSVPAFEQPASANALSLSKPNELSASTSSMLTKLRQSTSHFVPAGQSTQMIIGATDETDYEIIHVAEALYNKYEMKRVFYSAFINITKDPLLPETPDGPPLLREHRLYQADFLLRFYQFHADEIISADAPNLNIHLDPKCNWAVNHLEKFPIEIYSASYHDLLRIPGIGVKSAKRIISARKTAHLSFADLKKIGVVLKRAMYFITCGGKMMLPLTMTQSFILTNLLGQSEKLPSQIEENTRYVQQQLPLKAENNGGKNEIYLSL